MANEPKVRDNDAARRAEKQVAERRKAAETSDEETRRRMTQSTPTPTQAENDLAKVGALDIDSKVDDGSGPEERHPNAPGTTVPASRALRPDDQAAYQTRQVEQPVSRPTPASRKTGE